MKNKKSETRVFLVALLISLAVISSFTGCATTNPADSETAAKIIRLINEGNSKQLAKLSAESFLLDGEILHGSTLPAEFWNGLAAAGFTLESPVIIEQRIPQANDSALFGDSTEVRVFFTRYIPPQSTLFRIGSEDTEIVLILGPSEKGESRIIAFGGPF